MLIKYYTTSPSSLFDGTEINPYPKSYSSSLNLVIFSTYESYFPYSYKSFNSLLANIPYNNLEYKTLIILL